jgi:hypothetical protein
MQFRLKKTFLIIPVLLFLLSSIFFVFLLREVKKNINISKQAEINLQEEMLALEEAKDFNNFFRSIENEKILLESYFIQNSDVVPFLDKIEMMGSKVGIKTEVSQIEIAKDNSGLVLEIKNEGNFKRLYKFLLLLENFPYELEFTSVEIYNVSVQNVENLEKSGNNKVKNEWKMVLKIKLISFV